MGSTTGFVKLEVSNFIYDMLLQKLGDFRFKLYPFN